MKRHTALSLGLATAIAVGALVTSPAYAGADHPRQAGQSPHHAQGGGQGGQGGMMGGQGGMKQMMMRMHQQMMGGGMGGGAMMGGGQMGGISYLKGLDADGDGKITPEEARAGLQAKLVEFDADGDGTLSIAEFEALHSAAIREKMVDRFQMLDNDGDGVVTAEEITAPAKRMEKKMQHRAAQKGGNNNQGMGMNPGAETETEPQDN